MIYIILRYIYVIIAIILATAFSIKYIYNYYLDISFYTNEQFKETTGIIKNINCDYIMKKCYADIEYTINNVKYINDTEIPNNLKVGNIIKIKYNSKAEGSIFYYENKNLYYSLIYIILLIIFTILLWLFLIIVIIYPNKYIFIIYAIIATVIITYLLYNFFHNH